VPSTRKRFLAPPALHLYRPGGLPVPGIVYRIYGTVHNIIEPYTYNTQCAVLGVGSSPASTTFPVLAAPASIVVVCVIISGLPPVRLSVDKYGYPRTTYEYGNHVHICVYSYSTVDVIKQRNMVNSGVRGTSTKKDRNPRSGWIGILL
jgi:hypothetical protein